MPTYISLIKWTDQGIRHVKDSPQRLDVAKKAIETAGGKMTGFYVTMGRYDIVTISEMPNDETAATFLLGLGRLGNVRSETMRAFTEVEYRNIIGKIQ